MKFYEQLKISFGVLYLHKITLKIYYLSHAKAPSLINVHKKFVKSLVNSNQTEFSNF